MTNKEYLAAIKAIEDFKASPEYIQNMIKFREEYEDYMELETHKDNCHCFRCMEEFIHSKKMS